MIRSILDHHLKSSVKWEFGYSPPEGATYSQSACRALSGGWERDQVAHSYAHSSGSKAVKKAEKSYIELRHFMESEAGGPKSLSRGTPASRSPRSS